MNLPWLRRQTQISWSTKDLIATLGLRAFAAVQASAVVDLFCERFPSVKVERRECNPTSIVLDIDGAEFTIVALPGPLDATEFDFVPETSDNAAVRALAIAQARWIAGCDTLESDPVEAAGTLTTLAAVLCELGDVTGILWEPSRVAVLPADLIHAAAMVGPLSLPLDLWIGMVSDEKPDGKRSLFTAGLESLGLPEMEWIGQCASMEELREATLAVAQFILEGSAVPSNGDILTHLCKRPIEVYRSRSVLAQDTDVLRLKFGREGQGTKKISGRLCGLLR